MKNKQIEIDTIAEDISILCTAYCPICDREFDADDKDDDIAIEHVKNHIRIDHTAYERRKYFK